MHGTCAQKDVGKGRFSALGSARMRVMLPTPSICFTIAIRRSAMRLIVIVNVALLMGVGSLTVDGMQWASASAQGRAGRAGLGQLPAAPWAHRQRAAARQEKRVRATRGALRSTGLLATWEIVLRRIGKR
jgi:hypothetical protein